ncbi:receptor activity-modifying protein 3 [Pangasianodon hypophthalmus]|uniref:receptor activity-modifying protein 3 n=1 Tax=Pangasianodon hypophthalmus TaxID=310915 RepID=UPI000EFF09A1|nr:receptor activity-modifying protein 3 [Pangasianodon hypophthalmus]
MNFCPQTEEKGTHCRTRNFFQMDINTTKLLLFFVAGILAKENTEVKVTCSPRGLECNKTALHLEMEECGGRFKNDMAELDPQNWCNLTHFISEYHYFTSCTENNAVKIGCFWPHPVVEHYIILIHKQFFSNCTYIPMAWTGIREDTSTLTIHILIIVTVFLTLAMVTSVVWCSRQR